MTTTNHRLPPVAGRRQGLVLILEADRPIRRLVAEWLQMAEYRSMQMHDVAAAAKAAAHFDAVLVDVVLVDIPAPLRAARETIASVAAVAPHVPIIAMSADALVSGPSAAASVARELGVVAVLVKPFGREALMQAIERARV